MGSIRERPAKARSAPECTDKELRAVRHA